MQCRRASALIPLLPVI
uniref:Uncharacterized protein n=1 Tax=Anguilla anguilla TaxID=7936 RepID=A0A0E9U9A8_ANGAN